MPKHGPISVVKMGHKNAEDYSVYILIYVKLDNFSRVNMLCILFCLGSAQGPPLPRPILPRERGVVDRLLEYLVGDGPQNRYALICRNCYSHNGMALKEEFEYIGRY